MGKTIIIRFGFALMVLLSACTDKDKPAEVTLQGSYSGMFTVEYNDGDVRSNPVTINFDENKYVCSSGSNYTPAGGSGTFVIEGSKITFQDENFWTANFDWNLILSGEYNLSFAGGEIEISAMKNEVGFYQYKLSKAES